jgi:hypothetical protein
MKFKRIEKQVQPYIKKGYAGPAVIYTMTFWQSVDNGKLYTLRGITTDEEKLPNYIEATIKETGKLLRYIEGTRPLEAIDADIMAFNVISGASKSPLTIALLAIIGIAAYLFIGRKK